jgi:hypothetical protein
MNKFTKIVVWLLLISAALISLNDRYNITGMLEPKEGKTYTVEGSIDQMQMRPGRVRDSCYSADTILCDRIKDTDKYYVVVGGKPIEVPYALWKDLTARDTARLTYNEQGKAVYFQKLTKYESKN